MLNAQRCRDLADECRRLAAIGPPTEVRNRYLRMAEALLHAAEAEEPNNPTQESNTDRSGAVEKSGTVNECPEYVLILA